MLASPRLRALDRSVPSKVHRPARIAPAARGILGQGLASGLAAAFLLVLTVAILAPAEITRAADPGRALWRLFLLGPTFAITGLCVAAMLLVGVTLGRVGARALLHLLRLIAVFSVLAPPIYSLLLFTFWNGRSHLPLLLCSALVLPLLVRLCDRVARSRTVVYADSKWGIAASLLLVLFFGAAFARPSGTPARASSSLPFEATAGPASKSTQPAAAVLLVTVDTLRADHLSAYGYPRRTSPTLDTLAAEGMLFERVIAASSGSMPALATLISGQSPQRHGVVDQRGRLGDATTTLAERFSSAGFVTVGVVVNPLIGQWSGLDQGFDKFETYTDAAATVATASLLDLLPRRDDKPLFAWLHLYEPHTPYEPDPELTADFLRDSHHDTTRLTPIEYGSYGGIRIARTLGDRATGSGQDLESGLAAALYDGEILVADRAIAELLDGLESVYRDDEMVVLLTADHGEILNPTAGDLFYQHALEVYQPAIHIPAILWAPGRLAAASVHQPLACQEDLAPTLLAVAGLTWTRSAFSGVDVLDGQPPHHGCVSQTAWWDDVSLRALPKQHRAPTYALLEDDWKLIARFRSELDEIDGPLAWLGAWRSAMVGFWRGNELYRLGSDPDERFNLIDQEPERAAAMLQRLAAAVSRD